MALIRHMAIFTDDPQKLARFYAEVFGLKITGTGQEGEVWITDGYLDIALIKREQDSDPKGVNHFGFTLEQSEQPGIYERLRERGSAPFKPPRERAFVEDKARDPDGNKFDLSVSVLRREMVSQK